MRQEGYRVTRRDGVKGPAWMVQVWDVSAGQYGRAKTFAARKLGGAREAERAAIRWARDESAMQRAGAAVPGRGSGGGVRTAEALDLYLGDRQRRGGNRTQLANVRRRLGSLVRWCPDLAADDAPRQVYAWWSDWCDEPTPSGLPKAVRTKNNGLTDCKAFLSWVAAARAVTGLSRPVEVAWIQAMREPHEVPAQFTVDEIAQGLRLHRHPFRVRWALYAYLGARRSEALGLRWEHIAGGHVLLEGKGRKQRLVPMQSELETILRLYRRQGGNHAGWLFDERARRDDGGNLVRRFDAFLRSAGIEKGGRCTHSLRHCYAGLMTATGEPTALLQAYMGHAGSDMTRHYAQAAARYRQAVEGWPRGQLPILRRSTCRPDEIDRQRGPWSNEDVAWLRDHWGRPMREIAARLGRSRAAIYRYGLGLGLPARRSSSATAGST
jgi:integrase